MMPRPRDQVRLFLHDTSSVFQLEGASEAGVERVSVSGLAKRHDGEW